jgi:hypothetical protein
MSARGIASDSFGFRSVVARHRLPATAYGRSRRHDARSCPARPLENRRRTGRQHVGEKEREEGGRSVRNRLGPGTPRAHRFQDRVDHEKRGGRDDNTGVIAARSRFSRQRVAASATGRLATARVHHHLRASKPSVRGRKTQNPFLRVRKGRSSRRQSPQAGVRRASPRPLTRSSFGTAHRKRP